MYPNGQDLNRQIESEASAMATRYARRHQGDLYSPLRPEVIRAHQERLRAIAYFFRKWLKKPMSEVKFMEVGCGYGGNLLELIWLGLKAENVSANELLPDRIVGAKTQLSSQVRFYEGDALKLDISDESFDVVFQSTVFSSILNQEVRKSLATKMWNWVKPGGGILWYDFVYNNPNNKDVTGIKLREVRELFPEGKFEVKRVTLAPPIARKVVKLHPSLWTFFNAFPFLRTHAMIWVSKVDSQST